MIALYKQYRRQPNYKLLYRGKLIYCTKTGFIDKTHRGILNNILPKCDWEGFLTARDIAKKNKNFTVEWRTK